MKTNHTSRFLGKYWYTLPPLELPDSTYVTHHNITHPNAYRIYDPLLGWKLASDKNNPPYITPAQKGTELQRKNLKINQQSKRPIL